MSFQSNKIEQYFSPSKNGCSTNAKPSATINSEQHTDITKEIDNIEEFFKDDDDAFKDIIC